MKRWGVKVLVIGTILLCLGVGGYAGQVYCARSEAEALSRTVELGPYILDGSYVRAWRGCPPWGLRDEFIYTRTEDGWAGQGWRPAWIPRRTYREVLCLVTGLDLGDDPADWEAWVKAHPNLVWDEKVKRLVEGKP